MSLANVKSLQLALPLKSPRFKSLRPVPTKFRAPGSFPSYEGLKTQNLLFTSNQQAESLLNEVHNGATVFAMRHGRKVKKLGRLSNQRKALVRGLVTELLRHGKIKTTTPRAKAIRPFVDKMIGLAKRGDLHARRQALAFIYDKKLVRNIFDKVPERYKDRSSGFTRIKKEIKHRRGDNAELSSIELV